MTFGKVAFWSSVSLLFALGIASCALAIAEWRSWSVYLRTHTLLVNPDRDITGLGQAVLVEGRLQSVAGRMEPLPSPLILGQSERLTKLGKRGRWEEERELPEARIALELSSGTTVQIRWIHPVLGRGGSRFLKDANDFRHRWVGFAASDPILCRALVASSKPVALVARNQDCEGGDRALAMRRSQEQALLGAVMGVIALALVTWIVWMEKR